MRAPERVSSIPVHLKILAALQFFGQGCYQRPTGKSADLSVSQPSRSRIIEEVTNVLNDNFLRVWVKFSETVEKRRSLVVKHYAATNLPGVLGFVDGSLIAIKRPVEREELYVNRKSFHSLNVQVACDSDLVIFNVVARYPGATNDSYIWKFSALRTVMERNYRQGERCWLLGDSGYPQEPWLHIPILDAQKGTQEFQYTKAHMQARNCVERCIGVLKKRFRCLLKHRTLEYSPEKSGKIVNACAISHNMCVRERVPEPPELLPEEANAEQAVNELNGDQDQHALGENNRRRAYRARDALLIEGEEVRFRNLVRIQVVPLQQPD